MRKQMLKILLVLLLGAVLLPAGSVGATVFNISSLDSLFSVEVDVKAFDTAQWKNNYGVAVGALEWIYTYQIKNISSKALTAFSLQNLDLASDLAPGEKPYGYIDLGGYVSPSNIIPYDIGANKKTIEWAFNAPSLISPNDTSDLLYLISTVAPVMDENTYVYCQAILSDTGWFAFKGIPGPGEGVGKIAPSLDGRVPEPATATLLLLGMAMLAGAGVRSIPGKNKG